MDNNQKTEFYFEQVESRFNVGVISDVGGRDEQQDSYLVQRDAGGEEILALICDGMGGYQGGRLASQTAVKAFEEAYEMEKPLDNVPYFLQRAIRHANESVKELRSSDAALDRAGTTAVGVIVKEGRMNWVSSGDSRGYLIRSGEMVQFTMDQNYRTVLDEQRNAGVINEEQYDSLIPHGDGLISFLGIDELKLIDYNSAPLTVKKGDKILLATDGLYRMVPEESILSLIETLPMQDALNEMNMLAESQAASMQMRRDNLTAILLEIL